MNVYRWLLSGALVVVEWAMLDMADAAFHRCLWMLFFILSAAIVAVWAAIQFTIPPRVVILRVKDEAQ